MEAEDLQAVELVRRLQLQLARAIDRRQVQDCNDVIDELTTPQMLSCFPNSLNWYIYSHHQPSPLLHAIAKGHEDIALLLLQHGCDPFAQCGIPRLPSVKLADHRNSKSLFRVLEKPGFERVFRKMLEKAEKLIVDKNGDTVLHVIARKKLQTMFEAILHSKWLSKMLRHANDQGFLPMHIAVCSSFLPFFQVLFQSCCPSKVLRTSSQSRLQEGETCPSDLCNLTEHIQEAIDNLSINTPVKANKATALHLSAVDRCLPMVEMLIELGANVNALDETGKTPLVECLDQRGGKTLSTSSASDLLQVCRIFLQAGADVNVRSSIHYSERRSMANDDIVTPLHLAAGLGAKDVVELLLNNGANPKQLSGDIGKIPLQFALELGHSEAALTLLSPDLYPEGFLSTHMDYAFNSLLHSADRCSTDVVRKIISLRCPLDRPNVNHLRPLDKAISSRNIPCVELLLNTEPSIVNVHLYQDPTAYPPLHLAASSGNVKLCQILLSYGADIYSRAYGKHMAYRKAFKFGRFETAIFLCEQMSRPFSMAERDEILSHNLSCEPELARRLNHRLEEIPTLVSTCLDAVRRTIIKNHLCFKDIHTLPVPEAVIRSLRYQNADSISSI